MANVPQTRGQNSIWAGLATTGTIPQEILKSGMSNLGKINYITRDIAVFSQFINTRFGKSKRAVNTRTPRIYQISELARKYPVTKASGDTSVGDSATQHRIIGISNDHAAELKVNDTLHFASLFTTTTKNQLVQGQVIPASGSTQGANVGPDSLVDSGYQITDVTFSRTFGATAANGEVYKDPEQVRVAEIRGEDSGGAGITLIVLDRCFHSTGSADLNDGSIISRDVVYGASTGIGADAATATITVSDVLLRSLPSFYEGTGAPDGLHKNVELEENFTQEYKYAVEITNEQEIESTWISENPMDINRWLVTRRMMRDLEYCFLFGRKAYTKNSQGGYKMMMGGAVESIPNDSDHFINYAPNSLSWPGLLEMGKEIFILGGSDERFVFTGYSLDAALRAMFYNSGIMRINPEMSKEFNVEVNTINVSGGQLHIVPSQIMEEAGWGYRGLAIDMTYPTFTPVTHKKYDMFVDKGPNGKGIQPADVQIYKEQVIGMIGLERRYREYNAILNFEGIK